MAENLPPLKIGKFPYLVYLYFILFDLFYHIAQSRSSEIEHIFLKQKPWAYTMYVWYVNMSGCSFLLNPRYKCLLLETEVLFSLTAGSIYSPFKCLLFASLC